MPMFELAMKDCVEWLRTIPDASVDLVVTDPAYASLEKHRAVGTTTRLKADWFPVVANEHLCQVLAEAFRILKPDAHCYVFCDQETMHMLHDFIVRGVGADHGHVAPFRWRKFLVWDKRTIGMGYSYRYRHECIVYLEKGKRRLNDLSIPDVLSADRVRGGYPTEKPVEILSTLVQQSSEPGQLVIDPFLGSGSTGEAALAAGRHFAGCDVTARAVELAGARLERFGAPGHVVPIRQAPAQGTLW